MNTTLSELAAALTLLSQLLASIPAKTVEIEPPQKLTVYPKVPEDLLRAGYCETRLNHHQGGKVIRGKANPRDIGIMQINLDYHLPELKRLGLDAGIQEDNLAFARILYDRNGVRDWNWSYDPKKDRCKNDVKLPARDSKEWAEIVLRFLDGGPE